MNRILVRSITLPLIILVSTQLLSLLHPIPVPLQLALSSALIVHIGCVLGSQLQHASYVAIRQRQQQQQERIKAQGGVKKVWQVVKYPLTASVALIGLYLLATRTSHVTMDTLLNTVFVIATTKYGADITLPYLLEILNQEAIRWDLSPSALSTLSLVIKYGLNPLFWLSLTLLEVVTKHWLIDNFFAIGFSILAVKEGSLRSIKVAMAVLWLLLFYDLYWVYASDVMVTVAKSINLPLKLQLPYMEEEEMKFSLLGLGDIVLPGLLLSLCFKFDIDCCILRSTRPKTPQDFTFPLYNWILAAYTLSLLTTYTVMQITSHPQPALIFIVPICTLALFLQSWLGRQRELTLWDYSANTLALRQSQLNSIV